MALHDFVEEVQVLGRDLVDKVKSLVHEGNVRRIIVRDEHGNTFIEIPVTVAAIGAVFAPVLAAVGAISALVCEIHRCGGAGRRQTAWRGREERWGRVLVRLALLALDPPRHAAPCGPPHG